MVEETPSYLSDHTASMRKALAYCQEKLAGLSDSRIRVSCTESPKPSLFVFKEEREKALIEFWSRRDPFIEQVSEDGLDVYQFRSQFVHKNLPCLITGQRIRDSFNFVTKAWVDGHNSHDCCINRDWFVGQLQETKVPVRVSLPLIQDKLDDLGRASECKTEKMTLQDFLKHVDAAKEETVNGSDSYYLKDWHFQKWLKHSGKLNTHELYTTPEWFEFDLLNNFLDKFTNGDYRFVYWGPRRSTTARHSDVLHSFSWSFNVHGEKEWTFYAPDSLDREHSIPKSFTVLQPSGTVMFVPSSWQHSVVNVEETLSINHNCVPSTILDLTWDCLCTEMISVDEELERWGDSIGPAGHWEARESMLRGCVGLDVTSFLFMVCTRVLDVMNMEAYAGSDALSFEHELRCAAQMLRKVTTLPNCRERLCASLESSRLGQETWSLVQTVIACV